MGVRWASDLDLSIPPAVMPISLRGPALAVAPHPRALPRLGALTLLALAAAACRGDSVVAPAQSAQPICETSACANPDAPAPTAAIVIAPLEDAALRIVPNMLDARARAELPGVLNALRADLLAGRLDRARIQLARSYDALERAAAVAGGSDDPSRVLDLADLSAIRLALVPASAALGVSVR